MDITPETRDAIQEYINDHSGSLLRIPEVREIICRHRMLKVKQLKEWAGDPQSIHDHALIHNRNGLLSHAVLWRPELLYAPLLSIEYVRMSAHIMKLLIIGPRSEAELLTAYAHGFMPENVTAIDLMSYIDQIDVGDMHHMPYPDNSFDVVVAGWVLAYSSDNQQAANEMLRVLKPGGYMAVGCVAEKWNEKENACSWLEDDANHWQMTVGGIEEISEDTERPGMTKTVSRYYYIEQLLNLFRKHIADLVFSEKPHPEIRAKQRTNLIAIFRTL